MTNKGLISKTQKKLTQLDSKKVNKLIKKNKNWSDIFPKTHTGQQAQEKMPNTVNYQSNTN